TAESVTKIEGYPQQMLLDGAHNRIVVFSWIDTYSLPDGHPLKQLVGYQDNGSWYWRIKQLSKITVLHITDRTHPNLVRELYYEGWYQTARKVDSTIRMASYSMIDPAIMWGWWRFYDQNGHDKQQTKAVVQSYINSLHLADFIPQIYVRTPDGHFETNSLS